VPLQVTVSIIEIVFWSKSGPGLPTYTV